MDFAAIFELIKRYGVFLLAFFAMVSVDVRVEAGGESVTETCQWESMTARCRWNSEVIVMTSARWGRMRTGRCLSIHPNLMSQMGQDPMFFGCSADILSVMDRKCSGRSECDVRMTDPDLDSVKPCYPDLKNHLEAAYTCVRVVQESRTCKIQVSLEEQYISSSTNSIDTSSSASSSSSSSSCGSVSHPWRLEAAAGQRINISLIDFAKSNAGGVGAGIGSCYGCVLEKMNKKNVSLCAEGVTEQRERAVYTSETNNVNVVLTLGQTELIGSGSSSFIVRIEAVGCSNIVPPDNAWLRRSENDIIIGCYSSQDTWRLKCDGHDWKGTVGTCPELYVGPGITENVDDEDKDDSNVVFATVVTIAAAAVIICFTIICVGCLCLRRYKFSEVKKSSGTTLNVSADHWANADRNVTSSSTGTHLLNQSQNYSDNRQLTHDAQYRVGLLDNNEHV